MSYITPSEVSDISIYEKIRRLEEEIKELEKYKRWFERVYS